MSGPPARTGDRLALVVGTSLPAGLLKGLTTAGSPLATRTIDTAWGPVEVHETGGAVILPRHGTGRPVPAHLVDHRAHVAALAAAGCGRVVSLASTGSLRADWPPGTVVCPDDLFAPTANDTFFDGVDGHRVPGFDVAFRAHVLGAWRSATATPIVDGGVYAQTTGPRFETPAEVRFLAQHADLVGMTMASECFLAREAELAHMGICTVDNLANGLGGAELSVDELRAAMAATHDRLQADLTALLGALRG